MDTMKSLRAGAGLPRAAWGELINSSCFIDNRLPTTANDGNISPYEIFNGRPPDLSILRVIGCKCYVHEHLVTRRTLDPNCTVGIMIGYSSVGRRYRILTMVLFAKQLMLYLLRESFQPPKNKWFLEMNLT